MIFKLFLLLKYILMTFMPEDCLYELYSAYKIYMASYRQATWRISTIFW